MTTLEDAYAEGRKDQAEELQPWKVALQHAARHYSSDWPQHCQETVRLARAALAATGEVTECQACYGKGWNEVWRRVSGHHDGGEMFREECDECGGDGWKQ